MDNLTAVFTQLRQQREQLNSQLSHLDQAIQALSRLNGAAGLNTGRGTGGRRMSASARARIAAAQRKRWAKWKKQQKVA